MSYLKKIIVYFLISARFLIFQCCELVYFGSSSSLIPRPSIVMKVDLLDHFILFRRPIAFLLADRYYRKQLEKNVISSSSIPRRMLNLYCLSPLPTTEFLAEPQALIYIQFTYLSPELLTESRWGHAETIYFFSYFTQQRRSFQLVPIEGVFDQKIFLYDSLVKVANDRREGGLSLLYAFRASDSQG